VRNEAFYTERLIAELQNTYNLSRHEAISKLENAAFFNFLDHSEYNSLYVLTYDPSHWAIRIMNPMYYFK
jgi:hypothetical protein